MRAVVAVCLIVMGVVHLVPLAGVLGAAKLSALYGIDASDPTLAILMRHRAVLFGVLGAFFIVAAFVPSYQLLALVMGTASAGTFVAIAWTTRGANPAITTIVHGDLVALAAAALAIVLRMRYR